MALIDNLVAFWELEEASGTRADSTASGLDLTDTNTVTQATGKVGQSAQFTRANSETLIHGNVSALQTGDIDFTIQAWVYLDSKPAGTQMRIVSRAPGAGSSEWYLTYYEPTNHFYFGVSNDGTSFFQVEATTFGAVSLSTWTLVHCWHDSVNNLIGIAVNGGAADTVSHSLGVYFGTNTLALSGLSDQSGFFYDGRMDQVGFWKRVVGSTDRSLLYNSGAGLSYSAMVSGGGGGGGGAIPIMMNQHRQRRNYIQRPSGIWAPDKRIGDKCAI